MKDPFDPRELAGYTDSIGPRRIQFPLAALGVLSGLLLAVGCPGSIDIGGNPQHDGTNRDQATRDGVKPFWTEKGVPSDRKIAPSDEANELPQSDVYKPPKPDIYKPKPDTYTPPQPNPPPAHPAAPAGGQICIDNVCYTRCAFNACKTVSSCPSNFRCTTAVHDEKGQFVSYVCTAATAAAGQKCSKSSECPNDYICGSMDGASFYCLPLCTLTGKPCGTGFTGQCMTTSDTCVNFCSVP